MDSGVGGIMEGENLTILKYQPLHQFKKKLNTYVFSSGSSGRVRGAEKHEIYAATFGDHPFYDLFSQGQGGHGPLGPPWIRYWC